MDIISFNDIRKDDCIDSHIEPNRPIYINLISGEWRFPDRRIKIDLE